MISWREFVREVQLKDKISYKEAMSRASVLWKKKPQHEKKTKPKKHDRVPDISQFPKNLRFKKKNPKVYTNPSQIKRRIPDILTPRGPRPLKRRKQNHSGPIDDHRFRYLNLGSDYVKI